MQHSIARICAACRAKAAECQKRRKVHKNVANATPDRLQKMPIGARQHVRWRETIGGAPPPQAAAFLKQAGRPAFQISSRDHSRAAALPKGARQQRASKRLARYSEFATTSDSSKPSREIRGVS